MITWQQFLKESMPIYMEQFKRSKNPHGKAMKQIGKDWKAFKKSYTFKIFNARNN
jgi:hypothetical protein